MNITAAMSDGQNKNENAFTNYNNKRDKENRYG